MHTERSRHSSAELRLPAAIRRDLDLPKYQPLDRDAERQVAESIWSAREAAWSVILSERVARGHAVSLLGLGVEMADMLSAATVARHDQDDAALRACVAHLSPGSAKAAAVCLARVDAAVRRLERHNVKLVLYVIARWFRDLTDPARSPFEVGDLLGWGMFGCRTAALRFDPATGNKFSTFATHWIRAHIMRNVQDNRHRIRIPIPTQEAMSKIRSVAAQLGADDAFAFDDADLSAATGLKVSTVALAREAQLTSVGNLSLDQTRAYQNGETPLMLLDGVVDEQAPDLDAVLHAAAQTKILGDALSGLWPVHRVVVEARYGVGDFEGEDEASLEEIGGAIGLSRERARQLSRDALVMVRQRLTRMLGRDGAVALVAC